MSGIEKYAAPASLDEAVELLRSGPVTILAGGTDLMPQSRAGRARIEPTLMNIRRVPELRGIVEGNGLVRIGALTTMTEMLDSAFVRQRLNVLWQACDHFASDQLRNAGTIGGNICNASPAGDTLVPLLVLNAQVILTSKPNGVLSERKLSLADFIVGPGRTRREPHELLTAVEMPLPAPAFISEFFKFGTRPALDISTISIGFGAVRSDQILRDVRIAFGAVAPTPIRAPRTEQAVEGQPLTDAVIARAAGVAEAEVRPIDDVRASGWYRREMIRNMLRRMFEHVRSR